MSIAAALLAGRRLPVSDVDVALIAEGLRLVEAQLRAECAAAVKRGERSETHEVLLAIINGGRWTPDGVDGDGEDRQGLLARVLGGREPLRIFEPGWVPTEPGAD